MLLFISLLWPEPSLDPLRWEEISSFFILTAELSIFIELSLIYPAMLFSLKPVSWISRSRSSAMPEE
jgi:hypothetical protein